MFFGFNILGLLIVFMLVVIYRYKDNKDKYPFNLILWFSYILQLLYIVTFVSIKNNNSYLLFGKLYFVCLVWLMILFSVYNLVYIIKDKYKYKDKIINSKINLIKISSGIVGGILGILVFTSKMWLMDTNLVFGNNIVAIIMWGLVVFNYLVLIINKSYKMMGIKKC